MHFVRWTPLSEVGVLQNQMNRLFDTALQGWTGESNGSARGWTPAADIYESESELVVTLDLPGIDSKMVDVRVENNVLTIRGERQLEVEQESENIHRVERSYGPFARAFTLSTAVDADKIQATYKSGVLRIALPKAETAKPKRIHVAASAA
jgi:HSP20 family protein